MAKLWLSHIESVDPAGDHHVVGVHRDLVRRLVGGAQVGVRRGDLGRRAGQLVGVDSGGGGVCVVLGRTFKRMSNWVLQ